MCKHNNLNVNFISLNLSKKKVLMLKKVPRKKAYLRTKQCNQHYSNLGTGKIGNKIVILEISKDLQLN